MTHQLIAQLERTLPQGMTIPDPIRRLYQWIEHNGYYEDRNGIRYGYLYPLDALKQSWHEDERAGGTLITFYAATPANLQHYDACNDSVKLQQRLCIFARSGSEGSQCAFWLDNDGRQHIVHLGSGSGSILSCVLADDAVDFLRLLAIGYDEICWNDNFADPPNTRTNEPYIHPNTAYRDWVSTTFHTTIPVNALAIVRHPAEMGDHNSPDPFCRWISKQDD